MSDGLSRHKRRPPRETRVPSIYSTTHRPSIDSCARRVPRGAGNPAQEHLEESIMDNLSRFSPVSHGNAFSASLSLDTLRERVPAVFAPSAHEKMSSKYTFIPTERVL